MRIVHISDVHVPAPLRPVPMRDWLSKRLIGGANYVLRRKAEFAMAAHKLSKLADWVRAHPVDTVMCTGDLTTLGTSTEFEVARAALEPLITASKKFVLIPGNHDIYVHDAVEEQRYRRFFERWDLPQDAPLGPHAWMVRLDSPLTHWKPWRSDGRVPRAQLDHLERIVNLHGASKFIIVLTHYAMRKPDGEFDSPWHGLQNAAELEALCQTIPHGAVLHGHIHRAHHYTLNQGNVHVFGAGSTTQDKLGGFWYVHVQGTSPSDFKLEAQRAQWINDDWQMSTQPIF